MERFPCLFKVQFNDLTSRGISGREPIKTQQMLGKDKAMELDKAISGRTLS